MSVPGDNVPKPPNAKEDDTNSTNHTANIPLATITTAEPQRDDNKDEEDEWHSYSIKFDYYHDVIEVESNDDEVNTPRPAAHESIKSFEPHIETTQILESLKSALTFLLHPQSPLFDNNDDDDDDDPLFNFQEKCAMYNNNTHYDEIGDETFWEQRLTDLQSLYKTDYRHAEHHQMNKIWSVWKEKSTQNAEEELAHLFFINESDTLRLSEFSQVFMQSAEQTLFELESNAIKDSIYTDNVELNANFYDLKSVKKTKTMSKWLRTNQLLKSMIINTDDEINTNTRPMVEWTWRELVAFVTEIDELAHFSSVLYQYQINGRELCAMELKHIQCLIECSMVNNNDITLNELADIKLQCKQKQVEWHIIQDAKNIKHIVDKIRVQSHIVAEYHFAIKILKSAGRIFHTDTHRREASKIFQLIELLQVDPLRGPKYFWKMHVIYFNKIDNFLAVLLVNQELRHLFQKCFPDFLVDENNEITRFDIDHKPYHQEPSRRGPFSLNRRLTEQHIAVDRLGDIQEDILDKSIDFICCSRSKCCRESKRFVHDLERLYIKTFCVLLISLLTGCICISIWYWYSSILQINEAMSLSLNVLGTRTRNRMVYEFWKPQMFTNTVMNAFLHTTLLSPEAVDPSYVNDTTYDYYLQQFAEHGNTAGMEGIWLYNNDTNGMIGAYRSNEDVIIASYDGRCMHHYYYSSELKTRDITRKLQTDCNYVPRIRPWFYLGVELAVTSSAQWTDPYLFAFTDDNIGSSLVTPMTVNGTFYIMLSEISVRTLSSTIMPQLPVGTILMVATPSLDVIFSTKKEIDIQSENRTTDDELIRKTINHLRDNRHAFDESDDITFEMYDSENEFYFSIYPFSMLYINFFSELPSELMITDNDQNGFVILANDSSYLDPVAIAYNASYVILIVMLSIGFINICWQSEYDKMKHFVQESRGELIKVNRRKNNIALKMLRQSSNSMLNTMMTGKFLPLSGGRRTVESPIKSESETTGTPLYNEMKEMKSQQAKFKPPKQVKNSLVCHCSHDGLLIFTLCQIVFTLLLVSIIWEYSDSITKNVLLNEIIPKNEYNEVADEVRYMFEISDMVKKTFEQNYESMVNDNEDVAMDQFLINMMKSYVRPDSEFTPFMIYYGTPQGRFLGTIRVPNTKQLLHLRRDESTGFARTMFDVIEGNVADYVDGTVVQQKLYDPRCRPWYVVALDKSFSGSMSSAYPTDSFFKFVYDELPPSVTQNCVDAKVAAKDLYNITLQNSDNYTNFTQSNYINNDERGLVWARYVFAELTTIGLTASSTITNDEGEVLAVIAIDWVLDSLSQLLLAAVGNDDDANSTNNSTNKEYSWIFEAHTEEAAMISSSDGITITDTSKLGGCLTFSGGSDAEQVPYIATDHPTFDIRVNSKEIINIHKISSLPINSDESTSVVIPLGLPHLESGRIAYYDIDESNETEVNTHLDYNVDWVVSRTLDQSTMEVEDIRFTIMLTVSIIFAVALLLRKFSNRFQKQSSKGDDEDDAEFDDDLEEELTQKKLFTIMRKMKPMIMESANAIWHKKYRTEMGEDYKLLMTTDMTKDFCANRANRFIASTEDRYLFYKCVWSYCDPEDGDKKILFHEIMHSSLYSTYILCVIGFHLMFSLFDLTNSGIMYGIICCIALEFIDCVCMFIKKYIEWNLDGDVLITLYQINFGFKHRYVDFLRQKFGDSKRKEPKTLYLIFAGPNRHLIISHLIILLLIVIDFVIHISHPDTFSFAYYVPILPALLILRNIQIRNFGKDFIYSVWKSKHVLLSYLSFIFMISILTISLFGFMTTEDTKFNSFYSISEAIVTSFVYMSTAENYKIVYDIFEEEFYKNHPVLLNYALCFLIIVGMLGTFCFIPVIIHQFEFAFNELELVHKKKFNFQKTNCIIAAFILLDMNNDQGIDHEELKQLISKSILMDKNKVFNVFESDAGDIHNTQRQHSINEDFNEDDDDEQDDDIDLVGFVNYLMAQEFRNKIKGSSASQNKLQALLECNIIRRPQYNNLILITLVIPTYIFSVLKGLNGFSDASVEYVLIILFALNFVDINMRWFSFGFLRYFDVKSHPDPNYIVASMNRYYSSQNIASKSSGGAASQHDNQANTRLSAAEIQWGNKHLNEIQPLSIENKSILTLMHRIEFVVIYCNLISFIVAKVLIGAKENETFAISFIQFGILLRTFTLLKSNQILMYSIFTVFPQFISLIIFLFLYIYWWARLGLILFGNDITRIVIEEIYDSAPTVVANFNSSGYAILALIQLLFGEAWHEVMYLNALATSMTFTAYFIIYIAVVTIIVSNIFIGLFLAGIDDLDKEHKQQKDLKKLQKCLKSPKLLRKYAAKKLKSIQYQLKQNQMKRRKLNKQMHHINKLLREVNMKDF